MSVPVWPEPKVIIVCMGKPYVNIYAPHLPPPPPSKIWIKGGVGGGGRIQSTGRYSSRRARVQAEKQVTKSRIRACIIFHINNGQFTLLSPVLLFSWTHARTDSLSLPHTHARTHARTHVAYLLVTDVDWELIDRLTGVSNDALNPEQWSFCSWKQTAVCVCLLQSMAYAQKRLTICTSDGWSVALRPQKP